MLVNTVVGNQYKYDQYRTLGNSPKLSFVVPGIGDAYHPKVIALPSPINGFRYWCSFTPYRRGISAIENPCVNASNDLIHWTTPNGLYCPIDIPELDNVQCYNSDAHILFNDKTKKIELFWRYVDDLKNRVMIYRSNSVNGVDWTQKIPFLLSNNRIDRDYVSPVIMHKDNHYRIWYVCKKNVWYFEKYDDGSETEHRCILSMSPYELFVWHLDVAEMEDGELEAVLVAYKNSREHMMLYYSKSQDNVAWSSPQIILKPSLQREAWDSDGLYRSSIISVNNRKYLFYSGYRGSDVGVGLMIGCDIHNLYGFDKFMLDEARAS